MPGCYRPQVCLGVLAWLLQAPCWPWVTGLVAAAHMGVLAVLQAAGWPGLLSWLLQAPGWPEDYWPGCYRPKVSLGLLIWLLQPTAGTGLAATGCKLAWGYWPGCCRLQVGLRGTGLAATGPRLANGVLAWLLQATGLPGDTGLAAAAHRGFRPGCYSPRDSMGVPRLAWGNWPRLAWGYWPGCYRPQVGLGVLAWRVQPTGCTGLAATAHRRAWGTGLAALRIVSGH